MVSYHFIGIKGTGMSALAQILYDSGQEVQGSDVEKYFFTQVELEKKGIKIMPFSSENIQEGQIIIAGNAFPDEHEEVKKAKELDRKSTRLNSSHVASSYAVFCLKKKTNV